MKKTIGILAVIATVGLIAKANDLNMLSWPFSAPSVSDHTAVDAAGGEIVFNSSSNIFYGFNGSSWVQLSSGSSAITDWASYTPTLSSSTNVATNSARWRQVGDSVEVEGDIVWSGTGTGGTFTVNLPNSYTIDTAKISSTTTKRNFLGPGSFYNSGVATLAVRVEYNGSSTVQFETIESTPVLQQGTNFTNNDILSYRFTVPVNELYRRNR